MKSFLIPDKKKDSKRKTEEVNVSKLFTGNDKSSDEGIVPSSISFTKSLEYKHISNEMVLSKLVLIEVAIKQKYTHRSYVIATWTEPLVKAMHMLVKCKHPITPRMGSNIPDNMKVYNASSLTSIPSPTGPYTAYSSPNSRVTSHTSLQSPTLRTASESDMNTVLVHNSSAPHTVAISIHEPQEDALLGVCIGTDTPPPQVSIDLPLNCNVNSQLRHKEGKQSEDIEDVAVNLGTRNDWRNSPDIIDMSVISKRNHMGRKKNICIHDCTSVDDRSHDQLLEHLVPMSFEHEEAMLASNQKSAILDLV